MKIRILYISLFIIHIIVIIVSFQVGYLKGTAMNHGDPFRLIRDQTHTPYPSIDTLFKK